MPGDFFFLNYGIQDGNVMQGLFRVEKATLELQVFNGTQWVPVGGSGGSSTARAMSTVQRTAYVPVSGALIWDTDLERLFIGNGVTAGGIDTTDTNVKSLTTEERMAFIPKQGELIWDTTLGALYIGDGSTQGGVSIGGGGGSGIIAGMRLDFDGDTLNFNPVKEIVNVTGNSVTFIPDTAYKLYATTGAFNVTANPPAANYWGLEGHAEIFVGSVGYVIFDTSKIILANQLESDSVNNCTLRFHDGMCYISVEDHIAGYIVVNGSTSGEGSLHYGITSSTNDYVAFDASLNGSVIPLAEAVANGEKHVVGNGYTETLITGEVDCGTSKFTVANLSLNDIQISGGTMTLGDVHIPSGATVSVSGGGLAVEKVSMQGTIAPGSTTVIVSSGAVLDLTGNTNSTVIGGTISFPPIGATIVPSAGQASAYILGGMTVPQIGNTNMVNLGGSNLTLSSAAGSSSAIASGVTIISGLLNIINTPFTFYPSGCVFSSATIKTVGKGSLDASGCVFEGGDGDLILAAFAGTHKLTDCTIGVCKIDQGQNGTKLQLAGACSVGLITSTAAGAARSGNVVISGGASIVLTSGIYAMTIKILDGGCTINGVSVSATGETPYSSIVNSGGTLYIDGQPAE